MAACNRLEWPLSSFSAYVMHLWRVLHLTPCLQVPTPRVVVSVSRRTNVSSRSRLEKNCQRLGLVSWDRRLSLGHLRLVPKTSFQSNCAGHINESFATNSAARNGVVKTQTGSNSDSDILPRDPWTVTRRPGFNSAIQIVSMTVNRIIRQCPVISFLGDLPSFNFL